MAVIICTRYNATYRVQICSSVSYSSIKQRRLIIVTKYANLTTNLIFESLSSIDRTLLYGRLCNGSCIVHNGKSVMFDINDMTRYLTEVQVSQQEAQLSQGDRAAACLNYGKNIRAKSVHLGYFFKSPVATVSSTHYLGSLIMSYASFCHVTCAPCAPYRTHWPFLSVLISFHVIIIIIIIIRGVLLPALHTCPGMHYR